EEGYQKNFKALLSFLYSHEEIKVFLSLNGLQLSFLEEKHGEAVELIRTLISRKQLELSGGGYYSPVFPLLFPVDRTGQIEKLNTTLRNTTGKRPQGITIFKSIWDPSLITAFSSCGFEYIILDSSVCPPQKNTAVPLISSDMGRNLKVLLSSRAYLPEENEEPSLWLERMQKTGKNNQSLIVLPFSSKTFCSFTGTQFFKKLEQAFKEENQARNLLPNDFIKECKSYKSVYIPAGMDSQIAAWAKKAFLKTDIKGNSPLTVHDYLNTYPQNRKVYDRMVFVSMLLSQLHGGDKARKAKASESLWMSQCGINYINPASGTPAIAASRHKAFEFLGKSEKLIRECKDFKETVTSFDYNGDGLSEYVYQMGTFHAVVNSCGAQITEFDSLSSFRNYAANLEREETFDGIKDTFRRGFFSDHLIEPDALQRYIDKKECQALTFENAIFDCKKFDPKRFEILLETKTEFSALKLPVSLRKKFTATSSGFTVQCILKNEGPLPVKGIFITEMNFCETDFIPGKKSKDSSEDQFRTNLILKGSKTDLPQSGILNVQKGVSFLRVNDEKNRLCFTVEPNEDSGFSSSYIDFARPDGSLTQKKTSRTLTAGFWWNVELHSGMEIEKSMNFTVLPLKKSQSQQNS
ncbi:MAG: DUF1926 domain-containing protein, partial [Treponema sp.]|nr:DUF1926 domain-containing protein [Treponema sp.]